MKYVAYDLSTGDIKYFYESPVAIAEAPENLTLLEVSQDCLSSVVDTHKIVESQLVLIE